MIGFKLSEDQEALRSLAHDFAEREVKRQLCQADQTDENSLQSVTLRGELFHSRGGAIERRNERIDKLGCGSAGPGLEHVKF